MLLVYYTYTLKDNMVGISIAGLCFGPKLFQMGYAAASSLSLPLFLAFNLFLLILFSDMETRSQYKTVFVSLNFILVWICKKFQDLECEFECNESIKSEAMNTHILSKYYF